MHLLGCGLALALASRCGALVATRRATSARTVPQMGMGNSYGRVLGSGVHAFEYPIRVKHSMEDAKHSPCPKIQLFIVLRLKKSHTLCWSRDAFRALCHSKRGRSRFGLLKSSASVRRWKLGEHSTLRARFCKREMEKQFGRGGEAR